MWSPPGPTAQGLLRLRSQPWSRHRLFGMNRLLRRLRRPSPMARKLRRGWSRQQLTSSKTLVPASKVQCRPNNPPGGLPQWLSTAQVVPIACSYKGIVVTQKSWLFVTFLASVHCASIRLLDLVWLKFPSYMNWSQTRDDLQYKFTVTMHHNTINLEHEV